MRKIYDKPYAVIAPIASKLMDDDDESGQSLPEAWDPMGKKNDAIVDEEDEVEDNSEPTSKVFFSNAYISKVWE